MVDTPRLIQAPPPSSAVQPIPATQYPVAGDVAMVPLSLLYASPLNPRKTKPTEEELANLEVTGNAGGGMVSVVLSGRMECRRVRIDPSVLSDPEMAEDLVAAAFNDAVNKANAASQEKLGAATSGLSLPPPVGVTAGSRRG